MFMAISRIRTLLSQFGFLCHCLPSTPLCINTCSLPSGFIVITRPQYLPHSHPSPTFQIFPGTAFIYFYWCGRVMAGESSRRSRNNPVTRSLFSPFLLCSDPHLLSETSFTGPLTPWIWGQQPVKTNIINIRAGYDWWHEPVWPMGIQN